MTMFDNMGQRFVNAAKVVAKESSERMEISKLKIAIKTEEMKIKENKQKIGEIIYESFKSEKKLDSDLNEICQEIEECGQKIKELKIKVLYIKDQIKCPVCALDVDSNVIYCPKCGTKLFSQDK